LSRRAWLAAAALVVAATSAMMLLDELGPRGSSGPSALSNASDGWLAARRYLEARGAAVSLLREPLESFVDGPEPASRPVLVLAFPWVVAPAPALEETIARFLDRGGSLVVAYSGDVSPSEELAGLALNDPTPMPVNPWRWWREVHRAWTLRPSAPGARPVEVWAQRVLPVARPGASVLYTAPGGRPAVTALRTGRGWLVMLPAEALSNGRLGAAGNADLLETLYRNLGRRWVFDEYHHGLVAAGVADRRLGLVANLLLAQLVLLYALAVVALARRQGPAWSEPPRLIGSATTFLVGVGGLHHQLGHHREAAALLLRRVRELDRGLVLPADLDRRAATAGPRELVAIAGEVARRRAGRNRS
jgi:hypothetical protein